MSKDATNQIALTILTPGFSLLLLIVVLANFCHVYRLRFISAASISLCLGMLIGLFLHYGLGSVNTFGENVIFTSEFFMLALLPPIIFWSGYQVYRDDFYTELGTILLFAVLGTLLSSIVVGLGLYYTGIGGLLLVESLMFGALISAVDPVATLAVFGYLGVDPTLNIIIFGEAILNDAVSIVLYSTFQSFNAVNGFTWNRVGDAVFQFFLVILGSSLCGALIGIIGTLLVKYCQLLKNPIAETQTIFVMGLLSFYLTQGASLSGIIGCFTAGIIMGMYADRNLSKKGRSFTHGFLETISSLSDILIFLKIGMSAFLYEYSQDFSLATFSFFLCLLGRAIHIFSFSYILNLQRVQKIPWSHQIMMWHAGLRGAIAFTLAIQMDTPHQGKVVFATMFIVIATVLCFGCTTDFMLRLLHVDVGIETSDNSCFSKHDRKRRGLLKLHKKYIRPFLLRHDVIEEKLSKKTQIFNNENDAMNALRRGEPEFSTSLTEPPIDHSESNQDTRYKELLDQLIAAYQSSISPRKHRKSRARTPSPASSMRFRSSFSSSEIPGNYVETLQNIFQAPNSNHSLPSVLENTPVEPQDFLAVPTHQSPDLNLVHHREPQQSCEQTLHTFPKDEAHS